MSEYEKRDCARVGSSGISRTPDDVTSEAPLSITVEHPSHGTLCVGVTMRTIGHDRHLLLGFLYSEGIIGSLTDVDAITISDGIGHVTLSENSNFDPSTHSRNSTVTSSCGVCGRSTVDDMLHMHSPPLDEKIHISSSDVRDILSSMSRSQAVFSKTGGSHACASFFENCKLDRIFEDVGRHNAMDKIVGSYISDCEMPISQRVLLVSGRASFDLVQKAIRAGFPIMVAIGAPSTLAIDMANEYGLTLACFAKSDSLSVYSGVRRVSL